MRLLLVGIALLLAPYTIAVLPIMSFSPTAQKSMVRYGTDSRFDKRLVHYDFPYTMPQNRFKSLHFVRLKQEAF